MSVREYLPVLIESGKSHGQQHFAVPSLRLNKQEDTSSNPSIHLCFLTVLSHLILPPHLLCHGECISHCEPTQPLPEVASVGRSCHRIKTSHQYSDHFPFSPTFIISVCVCVCVCTHTCARVRIHTCMCAMCCGTHVARGQLFWVQFFYYVGPRDGTQAEAWQQAPLPPSVTWAALPSPNSPSALVNKHRACYPNPMTILLSNRYICQVLQCSAIYTVKCFLNPLSYPILIITP